MTDTERCLSKTWKTRQVTRHLRASYAAYYRGEPGFAVFDTRVQGWIGHAVHGDTWGLRQHVLADFLLRAGDVPGRPRRGAK